MTSNVNKLYQIKRRNGFWVLRIFDDKKKVRFDRPFNRKIRKKDPQMTSNDKKCQDCLGIFISTRYKDFLYMFYGNWNPIFCCHDNGAVSKCE